MKPSRRIAQILGDEWGRKPDEDQAAYLTKVVGAILDYLDEQCDPNDPSPKEDS